MQHFDALMTHARLYVLADYLRLDGLVKLASKRLRLHVLYLGGGKITPAIAGDLAKLAKYLYSNTIDHHPGNLDQEQHLRWHISRVIAENIESFTGPDFEEVLKEGGDLTVDIFAKFRPLAQEVKTLRTLKRKVEAEADVTPSKKRGRTSGVLGQQARNKSG